VDVLAKTRGAWITDAEVQEFLRLMRRATPRPISEELFYVTVDHLDPYKDKKLRNITLEEEEVVVWECWRQMVVEVCSKIAADNPSEFPRVLEQIRSNRSVRGRRYFSKDKDALHTSALVRGPHNIYVEQNLSANNAVNLCQKVAELFGYFPGVKVNVW
jgi:hypothetical protein